jgi:hypothetical protein
MAKRFGIPVSSYQDWESDRNRPGPSRISMVLDELNEGDLVGQRVDDPLDRRLRPPLGGVVVLAASDQDPG